MQEERTGDSVQEFVRLEVLLVVRSETELLARHSLLLRLSCLGRGNLLDLLGSIDLVTHGIEDVLLLILLGVDTSSSSLSLNPVVSRGGKVTVSHSPDFGTDGLGELSVVSNDENTSLEGLERRDKGGERFSVQVVGRFIENDDVRSSPGSGSENDLDLLSSGKTTHGVVSGEFGFETEVDEVRFDFLSDEGSEKTSLLSLSGIDFHNLLVARRVSKDGQREKKERENVPSSRIHVG